MKEYKTHISETPVTIGYMVDITGHTTMWHIWRAVKVADKMVHIDDFCFIISMMTDKQLSQLENEVQQHHYETIRESLYEKVA